MLSHLWGARGGSAASVLARAWARRPHRDAGRGIENTLSTKA